MRQENRALGSVLIDVASRHGIVKGLISDEVLSSEINGP